MREDNEDNARGDKRGRRRVLTAMSCNWGWDESVPKHGNITSLSLRSCFLQTTVYGERDKRLHIHLWMPTNEWLKLRGTVLYAIEGVGFGVRFDETSEEEERRLFLAMNYYAANPPSRH